MTLHDIFEALPLEYKTERQQSELRSEKVNPGLTRVVAFAALWTYREYARSPEVTEVFRTEAEQRLIYPVAPARKSVHQFWRGCDMVIRGLGDAEHARVRDVINHLFPYGKLPHETCVYHDAGSGPHLHLQVKG